MLCDIFFSSPLSTSTGTYHKQLSKGLKHNSVISDLGFGVLHFIILFWVLGSQYSYFYLKSIYLFSRVETKVGGEPGHCRRRLRPRGLSRRAHRVEGLGLGFRV